MKKENKKDSRDFQKQLKEYKDFVEDLIETNWRTAHGTEYEMLKAHFRSFASSEKLAKGVLKILEGASRSIVLQYMNNTMNSKEGDKPFRFADHLLLDKYADKTIDEALSAVLLSIKYGVQSGWEAANSKNTDFISKILNIQTLPSAQRQRYLSRNEAARKEFQERKVEGMNLSERVWNLKEPFKTELETAIDVSFETGMSAQELSREVRSCLLEPNKLFRRVRDKYGNLQLSKAAKLYHPGQGVYRSSYKNAMRLTRSEINMAYRTSDFVRWKSLDFVVGIRIQLSNNHTTTNEKGKKVHLYDICDMLAGDYSKEFKFTGWHPQCRCFATPILKPYDDWQEDRKHLNETEYIKFPASNEVEALPKNFQDYLKENKSRIKGWKNKPYYIKDNSSLINL